MKDLFAQINEIRLCYAIQGEGYPLILLHGFAMYKEFWKWQIEALAKNFKVISLDSRGCGKTEHPMRGYSMELLADDVKALMDYLEVDKVNLAGHSFGGMIAQHFALKYPENLNKLILMSTFANLPLSKSGLEMYKQSQLSFYDKKMNDPESAFWEKMKQRFSREFYKEMVQNPDKLYHNLFKPKELMDFENENGTSKPQDILNMIEAIIDHDTLNDLKKIKNKTCIMAGENDKVVPKLSCELIHEKIFESELMIFNGGHFFMIEEAPDVNKALYNFLSK
ncbi:MAG: alpha/beta hydrolase [Candidatus Lokiarchaeota archaeon]|nr:alpha/beta hydrolase [Candidatus Lokiarchaeota archaeon]